MAQAEKLTVVEAPEPKKLHWRLVKALKQMNTRREYLIGKRSELTKEIEEIDAAILALE
jgi:hypothetical protein